MSYSKIITATVNGLIGQIIEVETFISYGIPNHVIVGLGNTVIKESKDRIKSSILASKLDYPYDRITQNLYPSGIKKGGTHFDLPLAIGILLANEEGVANNLAFIGELSLDGRIYSPANTLSLLITLKENGYKNIVIPKDAVMVASLLDDITFFAYDNLKTLYIDLKSENLKPTKKEKINLSNENTYSQLDFIEVYGQQEAIRATLISAIIGGNLLLVGPPGCGKTMISKRITSILPPLSKEEIILLRRIYETSNEIEPNALILNRITRSPHHSITISGMLGSHKAGEVVKAHLGVLLLDEITEYDKNVLEALREPLQDKEISITKHNISSKFPTDFMMVATMNKCRCGFEECKCTPFELKQFKNKLSKPLMDRIDIAFMIGKSTGSYNIGSDSLQKTVIKSREILKSVHFSGDAEEYIQKIYNSGYLSMRSLKKMENIAKGIAALENRTLVQKNDIIESLSYNPESVLEHIWRDY